MALTNLKNDITNLQSFDWGAELTTIVETNKDALAELQEDQLFEGKDKYGDKITLEDKGYSKKTVAIKEAKGQPTDRITWKDTGALYASLEAMITEGNFTFNSASEQEKFNAMIERSGEWVIGLNEEKRKQFAENITLPAINHIFQNKTGFKIS